METVRLRYLFLLSAVSTGLTHEELLELSLVELRDLVDRHYPLKIVSVRACSNGSSVKETIINKAA